MWREIAELRDVIDPAWPILQEAIAAADQPVEVLPVDSAHGETTLLHLQVTARSTLGALALHTGGLLIENGWLRILGGGEPPLNLAIANGLDGSPRESPDQLMVAFDALGGRFAINGGALPGSRGEVCYYAPETLGWLPLEMGYGSFVAWSLTHRLTVFYEHVRWPGWEAEVAALAHDEGLSLYPPPFTKEGRDLSEVSRSRVPVQELFIFWGRAEEQLQDVAEGGAFEVKVENEG